MPGETGIRVPVDDIDALAEAMREVDWEGFDPGKIREHATRFSPDTFKSRFVEEVARITGKTRASRTHTRCRHRNLGVLWCAYELFL